MSPPLDPAVLRDLTEAKAAVARHGIVIIRSLETELAPAIISEAKRSMASSPRKLSQMDDDELDRYTEGIRKTAMRSAKELAELYTRLLAKLGTENVVDLVDELDGIGQLMTWDRVSRTADAVNSQLAANGFSKISLEGPEALSESFRVELEDKWPPAFGRFRTLANEAAKQLMQDEEMPERPQLSQRKRTPKKR